MQPKKDLLHELIAPASIRHAILDGDRVNVTVLNAVAAVHYYTTWVFRT